MPLSTVLPSPSIEWLGRIYSPRIFSGQVNGTNLPSFPWSLPTLWPLVSREGIPDPSAPADTNNFIGYGSIGVAGTIHRWQLRNGRACARWSTTGSLTGTLMAPVFWFPQFGGGSGVSPGATQNPQSLVGVIDYHLSLDLAGAPAWGDDIVGPTFQPHFTGGNGMDVRSASPGFSWVPGGAVPQHIGGWGVFANNDGAGGTRYEYVSWATSDPPADPGAILERVVIGPGIVPDVQDWTTIRFIIVSPNPPALANSTLTVQVNGFDIVVARVFGSSVLQDPYVAAGPGLVAGSLGAGGIAMGINAAGPAGDEIFLCTNAKFGRYTPDGAAQQGE